MATLARYALLVLALWAPVLGASPWFAEPPDAGPVEAVVDLGDPGETDTVDAVITPCTGPRLGLLQGTRRVHDADAPEGPLLQRVERPPSA